MSTTIVSIIVLLLSQVLPVIGVHVGPAELENAVQTLVAIGVGLYLWYKRVKVGDVTALGFRK